MDILDKKIKEALENQEAIVIGDPGELGYFALGLKQFGGVMGWVTWVIMIVQTLLFIGGVYCAVLFFAADETLLAVKYGISGAVLLLMGINLKLSLAPQMQADRVLREVKRLELMIVQSHAR